MPTAPQITWAQQADPQKLHGSCSATAARQAERLCSEWSEAGRSNSLLGSWSCQVPTCSASTLQFSQLTGTRTLTRLQTLRPAHGHDEFLLPGSFCIAGVLFSFWFYTSQHANNCSVKDHVVLVLVWRYLRISDFLEAQLTCTHSTSLKHKHSHMDFVVLTLLFTSIALQLQSSLSLMTSTRRMLTCTVLHPIWNQLTKKK